MTALRILVVEDEAIIARDIELELLEAGVETVELAASSDEALAAAARLRPHLVLMDIHIQGAHDGIVTALALKQRMGIRSVFLSAFATEETLERAKAAEPAGYIIKPFDPYQLRSAISDALAVDYPNEARIFR